MFRGCDENPAANGIWATLSSEELDGVFRVAV
jgi:hypothetical protein